MGCSTSLVALAAASINKQHTAGKGGAITDREIGLIRKSWKKVSNDMPSIGARIFIQIFTIQPEIKQIFPFHDVTGSELLSNQHFKGHASRFMQAIGAAVDNIDELETAMSALLYGIGKEHIHYRGFNVDYFDVFPVAIMTVLKQEMGGKFDDYSSAWYHLLDFMISNLKGGYYAAKRNQTPPVN
ncbi:hypothetical protein ACF0H5_008357 [Mactra antiquata]